MKIKKLELETVCGIKSELPDNDSNEVAFWGRSNAGKSSLLNTLWERKSLARTSSQPGKTRTLNYYKVEFYGEADESADETMSLYMVDLPGYGYAKTSRQTSEAWEKMTYNYLSRSKMLKGVFLLVDSRLEPQGTDIERFSKLFRIGFDPIIVATKADKLKKNQKQKNLSVISKKFTEIAAKVCEETGDELSDDFKIPVIAFSSVTGEGRDTIWECLENFGRAK